ncbi:hypothetical protein VNO80_30605 [Phaseolus coccineus]|uniref:Uncharacterized protein n=1 Tax=Phaseolus coccineus TaxID=3886 RepID=A0AAN9LDH8_PHACN
MVQHLTYHKCHSYAQNPTSIGSLRLLVEVSLVKARRYLEDVLAHKHAILFRRFCRGDGRTTQAKSRHSNGQGSQSSTKAKTPNIPSPLKNQSLYVIPVPHRIDIVRKGRTR